MLKIDATPIALVLCLALAGMPARAWADPKPQPAAGTASPVPAKPSTAHPGGDESRDELPAAKNDVPAVKKVKTEEQKSESGKEKPKPDADERTTRPRSPSP